ncbi:multiheme c-type cytochrome [Primorskyibacter sp. S87]|uniref:multiheme c-type cytochrome n=1 Tax=Primorskyibacter sp. S87 TaxID=3415126 RepID=UPI003C7AAE13
MKINFFPAAFLIGLITQTVQAQEVPAYVGSQVCADCHEEETQAWSGSHHALAWTMPGPDTVIGDFDGTTFEHDGMSVAFSVADGVYSADVTEKDGAQRSYDLHSVVGIAPLQQYLFETEPGRLQSFDVTWDAVRQEWYHLYPDQDLPPSDGLHWTGPYKTWNARCAECHATGYERRYDMRSRTYGSVEAEIGVGCESCHGPGAAHLEWVDGKKPGAGLDQYGFTMSFGQGDTEADIQQCAGCHSRREALTDGNPLPGTPFLDAHNLAPLRPGLYHPDGQILDEVYVYGSFLQSKMYARGVGCMNCHDPHKAELKAQGNAVCTQCHSPAGNPDFPSLRQADYDTPDHHHHPEDSEGAQCKSCHMIERTYMGIDGRRDHSFRVPRPDLGSETGSPDACTDCHSDKDQPWAAAQIEAWYPVSNHRGAHFGQSFALARTSPQAAAGDLETLALDAEKPGIVRATALYLMQPVADAAAAAATAPLLADPDPLVRANAAPLQRAAGPQLRAERIVPLLRDPVRSVRIAAAREMLDLNTAALAPSDQALLRDGMRDWQTSLSTKLDFPETHLVLGGMALTQRNLQAAMRAFGEVVALDPQRPEAWMMMVRLTDATRGRGAARQVLRDGLKAIPGDPALLQLLAQFGG